MKRFARILIYGLFPALWLAVGAIGLEVWERYRTPGIERSARAYGEARLAQAYADNAAVIRATPAPAPPAFAPKDRPGRDAWAARDEEGRKRLAEERGESIFLCDAGGIVQTIYPVSSPPAVAELAARIAPGKPLQETFPSAERQDASAAFQTAASSKNIQMRDYPLPLSSGATNVFELNFVPRPEKGESASPLQSSAAAIAVFVQDSTWEVLWKKFRPHVYRQEPYVFWTNAQGFRDDEVTLPKPPGVFRIVCIGGSTTAEGPRNDLTYPKLLERALRERFKINAIEAVNAGIFALHSYGECERFDDYLGLQPDLIVHYNFVNDLTYGLPEWIRPRSSWRDPLKALKYLGRKSYFLYGHFNRWLMPSESEMKERLREGIIANLRTMADRAKKAGTEMAICSFARPTVETMSREEKNFFSYRMNTSLWGRVADIESYAWAVDVYNGLVRDLCRELNLRYIPVAEQLQGGIGAYSDQCHVFLGAMQRKADVMAETLARIIPVR